MRCSGGWPGGTRPPWRSSSAATRAVSTRWPTACLKDPLEAEDALQEVFLKVYEHAHRFEPQATVSAWLHRITANHCLNLLRRRHPHESLDQEDAPGLADAGPTPLQALEEQDLSRRLEQLLDALPENQRRALVLKRFAGLSYQEIGAEMGLSPQAVDGLLKQGPAVLEEGPAGLFVRRRLRLIFFPFFDFLPTSSCDGQVAGKPVAPAFQTGQAKKFPGLSGGFPKRLPRGNFNALFRFRFNQLRRQLIFNRKPKTGLFPGELLNFFFGVVHFLDLFGVKAQQHSLEFPHVGFFLPGDIQQDFFDVLVIREGRHLLIEVDGVQLGDDGRPENFLIEILFSDPGKIHRHLR